MGFGEVFVVCIGGIDSDCCMGFYGSGIVEWL